MNTRPSCFLKTRRAGSGGGFDAGWYKYVGHNGGVIGLDRFGASAPGLSHSRS